MVAIRKDKTQVRDNTSKETMFNQQALFYYSKAIFYFSKLTDLFTKHTFSFKNFSKLLLYTNKNINQAEFNYRIRRCLVPP